MMETTVVLNPEDQWPPKQRWYSPWAPERLKRILRRTWPDHISQEELVDKMDQALKMPRNHQCLDHAHPKSD